jgi:hypothetical protein
MSVSYGGDSIVFADGSVNSSGFIGHRNRIINGAMVFDQRNAGASVTLTSGGVFTVDRWQGFEDTDGAMTAQQDTSAPTGFVNSLKFTTTTADATLSAAQFSLIQQRIEGTNIYDLAWGTASAATVTLSFWVRSSLTGTFGGALRNSESNRSYPFTYTISVADTWEQKTITIAGDTSGTWLTTTGIGMQVAFGLGVGSTNSGTAGAWAASNFYSATGATSVIGTLNATFYITGVQLERGSTASSFEYRSYGAELALCQRYYEIVASQTVYIDNGSADNARFYIPFKVTKRATPTMTSGTGNSEGGQAWTPAFGTSSIEGTVCATAFTATARPYINAPIIALVEL